jgi:hypothetical protein
MMADALQVGGQGIIYETFHSNRGGLNDVNYDVYLTIYSQDWENASDDKGPVTSHVNAIPNPFDVEVDTEFLLTANINDATTGMSGIEEAMYTETSVLISDPDDIDWSFGIPMNLSGNTSTEVADAVITPIGWNDGEVHRFWVCGKDSEGNWCDGSEDYVDIRVEGPPEFPPGAPIMMNARLTGTGNKDVTLKWQLSPDDGAGENDVVGYGIYHGTEYVKNGIGYTLLEVVPAGSDTYVHLDAGDGDSSNYFYFVTAIDSSGLSKWNGQAGKYVRSLQGGQKELVSIPLIQNDTDILEVLKTIEGSYDIVHYYKSSDQKDHWKSFKPEKPAASKDLLYIDHKMGFKIKMWNDDLLIVAGLVPESTTITLEPAWNLIGYPSFGAKAVGDALSAIQYTKVEGWTDTPPQHQKIMSDSDMMSVGNGYWVRVKSTQVLTLKN